jgi:hypothetical protein
MGHEWDDILEHGPDEGDTLVFAECDGRRLGAQSAVNPARTLASSTAHEPNIRWSCCECPIQARLDSN